jgi:hypothetical protein
VPAEPEIALVALVDRVALAGLAGLDVRVAQVELEALAVPEDLVVPAVRAALVVPENPAARVGLVVPGDPVGLAVPGDPVVLAALVVPESPAVLELAPGEAQEPAIVQVAAELELDRVEARRRVRSAIAVHHRDRVVARRVEDSAVAAETTREPAATEAATAWAAEE